MAPESILDRLLRHLLGNLYFRFENINFRCLEEKSNGREKKSTEYLEGLRIEYRPNHYFLK